MNVHRLTAAHAFLLEGELVDEGIRFRDLPPNYVAWLLIPAAVLAFAWFAYRRAGSAPPAARVVLAGLRALAIFFVILLIFDPYRQFGRIEEIRSLVTVLVDDSASMARKESYDQDGERAGKVRAAAHVAAEMPLAEVSRRDLVVRSLGKEGIDLLGKLRAKHDVKVYAFAGGKPRSLSDFEELQADGPVTATGEAMAFALSDPDIQAKPNTSIVVIGDGRTNTGTSPVDVAKGSGQNERIPVHTVGVGDPDALRDLELRFVRADEVALKGNTVKMALVVRNHGFEELWATITVVDQTRQAWIAPQRKKIAKVDGDQSIDIDFTADRVGTFTLDVTLNGPSGEENQRNNAKKHTLVVKDERLRVLYVDTFPRWEYRRLKSFLTRGSEMFVTQCLLLSAEPNFIQETTRSQDPARQVLPLREFPTEFAELDKYDVIVFGDVDPNLLVANTQKLPQVLKNIQKFVDNGGGLVVVSGENWTPHAYADTPLEELLPVDISSGGDVVFLANYVDEWKPRLSAFGRTHPIMQLDSDPEENRKVWEDKSYGLQELRWWFPARKSTPAAQVLAFHPDQRTPYGQVPLFVAGSYGDGPVLFIGTDETWRWATAGWGSKWFNTFWGNVVRHLARAHLYRGSKRYKLTASQSEYQQGESVRLTAFVKDKNFEDSDAPTQRVMIVEPDSKGRAVEFEKLTKGEYTHSFKPSKFGTYEAWVVGDEGVAGERFAPVSFEVTYVDPERLDAAIDEDSLREIAKNSGGAYVRLEEAEKLMDRLKADTTRRKRIDPLPLRRHPWLPGVLLGLLTAEWLLRRRFRMV